MAYNMISEDNTITGVKYSLGGKVEGQWVCAESGGISYGLPVFSYVGENNKAYKYYNDSGKLVFAGDLVTANSTVVTVNGVASGAVVFDTDHATTMGLIVDALNAMSGVEAVLDSTDTDDRTIIIRTKGATAVVTAVVTLGGSQTTATFGSQASGQVFIGVAMRVEKAPSIDTATNQGYEQYDAMAVIAGEGEVIVQPTATVKAQETAYVDIAATDIGTWSNAGVAVGAVYRENGSSGVNTRLEVKSHTDMTYAGSF